MKWYVALGFALIVCGTVISTAAVPLSGPVDDLAPAEDTGVALAPADTPNGDRYASFDSNGELRLSVDVISGTKAVFDNVFVVGFGGVTGSDEPATIRIEHDSVWLDIYRSTDTGARESVDEANNTLTLDPDEQATLGFAVTTTADSPASLSETVTYTMEIPDAEPSTGGGGGGGGGGGSVGGGGGVSPGTVTPADDPTETPASGGGGGGTEVDISTDEPAVTPVDTQDEAEAVAGGGAEPVSPSPGDQQSAEPSGFSLKFDPIFGIGWGLWTTVAGLLAVVTNYLVQTRYHSVLPVLQTHPSDRRRRFRRVAVREAIIGLTALVFTVLAVSAASSAGLGPVSQLVTALTVSTAVGTVTGYRLVPDLDVPTIR
ncbi:hypothetical protein BDK61_4305 [Haloarcula quadrata]|uniref:Uncharacterized protein n=2 Tax=Haloarcula TaxID=2237 RepID=Q5V840_HALMA|nr:MULTISPECIES: hypothetical protein [Haloarcula]AAV44312.1 unknown [Haloarcula marismortui ATCC 43049]NHN64319.1 hypothetical protein [Haloarcula sp. JP-Z28]QCP89386.1 hypothetical protein E6P14_00180 [Haloarcula marismortui ATCC 43049]RKS75788.1 hypothetical protein BDK61_4305 [Haloarcula quadrata]